MAHAAPAGGFARTPDVFSPKVHRAARYGIPVVLGLVDMALLKALGRFRRSER